MSKLTFLSGAALIFLSACTRTEWVASVGSQRISKADVELRREMMKVQNPSVTQKEALDQLIKYKVGSIILEEMGQKITQKDIMAELKQMKTESLGNSKLGELLKGYERTPSFSEVFLYPRMVENKLKNLYENDKAFNEKELANASSLLSRANQDPAKFETIAGEMGIPFLQGGFSEKEKSISWSVGRGVASTTINLPVEPWFAEKIKKEALSKTETGKISAEIMPLWLGYLVLRKDVGEKNAYAFSVAVAPRNPIWKWMSQKSYLIPVTKFESNLPGLKIAY
jgi:hypothetical protein